MNSSFQYWFSLKSRYALPCMINFLLLFIDNSMLIWITIFFGMLFTYRLARFIDLFSKEILILDLIEMLLILQWLFVPALYYTVYEYQLVEWQWFYDKMQVSPGRYFLLALPCSFLFLLALRYNSNRVRMETKRILGVIFEQNEKYFMVGIFLCLLSLLSQTFGSFFSASFNFVFTLFNSLFYVGILYVLFSKSRFKWPIFGILLIIMVYSGLNSGMFGSIVWWPLVLLIFGLIRVKVWYSVKLFTFISGMLLFTLLHNIKSKYRVITWNRSIYTAKISKYAVLKNLINSQLVEINIFDWNFYYPLLNRLNQGVHVTRVINYVPLKKPFTNGKSLLVSISASILPRFIWKDKPKAGGSEEYFKYTGIRISRGTSMSIGQLGDAYVNFAFWGAPILLFLYGGFLNFLFTRILKYSYIDASLLLWTPLIFIDLINVEVDFLTVINYAIKTGMFVFIVFGILYRFFLKKRNQ